MQISVTTDKKINDEKVLFSPRSIAVLIFIFLKKHKKGESIIIFRVK